MRQDILKILKLMLVTNRYNTLTTHQYLDFLSICAKSGITSVQLREKNKESMDSFDFGKKLKILLQPLKIPLIVNDSLDLCLKLEAEGLHLGQKDGDVLAARKTLGPNKILGLTVDTLDQLEFANNLPKDCIDYIGIGAIFPSKTKPDAQIFGIDGLKHIAKRSKYPIVAIGGINEKNISSIMQSGAQGIAAIEAFHDTENPEMTTKNLRDHSRGLPYYD